MNQLKFLYLQIDKLKEALLYEIMIRMDRHHLSDEEKSKLYEASKKLSKDRQRD